MVTATQFVGAIALGGALLLAAAAIGHLRGRRMFAAVLAAQRVLPRRWRRPVAAVTGPVELLVGTSAVAGWLVGGRVAVAALSAVTAVFATYGLYLVVVRVRTPAAPCGCFGGGGGITAAVIARAWLFGAAAAAAAVLGAPVTASSPAARLWPLLPAAVIALMGWLIPELLPSSLPRRDRGRRDRTRVDAPPTPRGAHAVAAPDDVRRGD